MDLINQIRKEQKDLNNKYEAQINAAIKSELSKFKEGERLKFGALALNENDHDDHINHINADGTLLIYNTSDCLEDSLAYNEPVSVFDSFSLNTKMNILEIIALHNNSRPKMVQQILPPAQVDIIQRALNVLEVALKEQDPNNESSDIGHTLFDILCLRAMLKSEVSIILSESEINNFVHNHGVDFPDYVGEKYQPKEL